MRGVASVWRHWQRRWWRSRLKAPQWGFLFEEPPADQWVAIDCETTGLRVGVDEIVSIGAVRIDGDCIRTSQRFEVKVRPQGRVSAQSIVVHHLRQQDLADAMPLPEAVERLLAFMGPRPMVGYYLRFDAAMLDAPVRALLGTGLPQPRIEVSDLYQRYKSREMSAFAAQARALDLSLPAILADLGLPECPAHDPVNDALMAALAFVKLRHLLGN